jgi:hypothetical protein
MWASGHSAGTVKRAAHGYEPTREALIQLDAARHVQRSRGGVAVRIGIGSGRLVVFVTDHRADTAVNRAAVNRAVKNH